jgi:hypothetical protein
MRAERSRGSRIRSQSSRNELIKEIFVKEARHCRASSVSSASAQPVSASRNSDCPRIFTVFFLPYVRRRVYKARDDRDDVDAGY